MRGEGFDERRKRRDVVPAARQRRLGLVEPAGRRLCVPVSLWLFFLCALPFLSVSTACRRAPAPSAPPLVAQVSGTLAVPGLTAPVRIVRDTWGVPHIYAQNEADLFFAQGFVQAQDRLFQMDLWRRSAQGRLSEVLGPNFIERDAMTRRIQYRGDHGRGVGELRRRTRRRSPTRSSAASTRGWRWRASGRRRSSSLAGWKPELWSADDLLNRTDAFTASGDALDEVFRARLIATVGLARARLLLAEDRPLDPAAGVDPARRPGAGRRDDPPRRHAAVLPGTGGAGHSRNGPRCQPGKQPRRRPDTDAGQSVAAVLRPPERAGLERDRRDGAVAAGRRRGAQRSHRLDARRRSTPTRRTSTSRS